MPSFSRRIRCCPNQRRLARLLHIQYGSVLTGEIRGKVLACMLKLFFASRHTALNRGGFVKQYIIAHRLFLLGNLRQ